jgi:hypothetical protein
MRLGSWDAQDPSDLEAGLVSQRSVIANEYISSASAGVSEHAKTASDVAHNPALQSGRQRITIFKETVAFPLRQ